jgi:integrase
MAEPKKRGDKYRHQFMLNNERFGGTFDTKKEAREWEARTRIAFKDDPNTHLARKRHRLAEAVDRYVTTVSVRKRNAVVRETRRFNDFLARFPGRDIESITSDELALWRDDLLKTVTGSTVNRYFNLFSNLFTVAKKEWKWVTHNPFSDVQRPRENKPREAVWRWQQIKAVLREGQRRGGKYEEVTKAFHISLRTAMRLQESLAAPSCFDRRGRTVVIKRRKEASTWEKIPLTPQAFRLMLKMKPFETNPNLASTLFSKLLKQMGIKGLEFKDSRATALTLMARKMTIQTLQRISRHKDIQILMDVYYRETAEEISLRLDPVSL